uniref:S1-like domain-containing protein n=1 Tax=viral metagenome TaxID=1070528 RepID=A0A6C0ER80_9ZZZZ
MVKNTTGGSKTKGQARKFVTAPVKNTLRISTDECEVYAQVTKTLGNGMCHVLCIDGETRLCHIRGKFRGRGKRDNFIGNGSWLLVGLREWEVGKEPKSGKLANCDLLEVYDDRDKQRLKDNTTVNWSSFIENDNSNAKLTLDDSVVFADEKTIEYEEQIRAQSESVEATTISTDNGEIIDVDDI